MADEKAEGKKVKVRITFRTEMYIEAESLQDVVDEFESMELVSDDVKNCAGDFVELCTVEDAETYDDLMSDWDNIY